MAAPSYWNTVFRKSVSAAFTDVADWLTAIRTMLTSTLPVGSRWTEGATNVYTSPADPVSGYTIVLTLARTSAVRMFMSCTQTVNGVGYGVLQGECDISGSVQANIFAGPTHFWTEIPGGDFGGCVGVDTTPEPPGQITSYVFSKMSRNIVQAAFNLQADMWHAQDANVDAGAPVRARCQGPYFVANATGYEFKTAAGSFIYFPAVGVTYPTQGLNTNQKFCGIFPQFVWVDPSWIGGNLVPVPVDFGVIGVFQVVSSLMTAANNTNGAKLAIRVA